MSVTLKYIDDLFSYENINKLIVFRYLTSTSNFNYGDYDVTNTLSSSEVEKIELNVGSITIEEAQNGLPKSYIMNDANSDGQYRICLFAIPSTYKMVISNDTLIIYQLYLSQ